ncbi:hypothetical protein [Oceanobacillus neutriphilus]|uniref:Uncharacterized protein n=1 Tax=Oceanobacillus neutriphilus TaxID=531815 RepID=A0ABQ2NSC6_9BACI|nr:hypothetical protein [Oceanobacillus neutriphilus]GGP09142.1 hypothetical protein GCM10011346_12010 [Oceanobacillus neutriphilus]
MNDEDIEVIDSWDSNPLRVTNLEKTVVDMLRYKKASPGIVNEMLGDYFRKSNKQQEIWSNFEDSKPYAKGISFDEIMNQIDLFSQKLTERAKNDQ